MTVHYLLIENVDLMENKTEAGPQTVKCSFYKEMSKLSYKLSLRLKMNLFLRLPSEMVHNKKQHEKYQNVDEVVKEDHENQTNDAARNVSTHGRSNKMWCSEWKRQKVILDDAGWSAGAGTLCRTINPYVWSAASRLCCNPVSTKRSADSFMSLTEHS